MAQIANTLDTYGTKGIREDLADVIYNITPEETPFISNAGKGKAGNTYFEWQTDTLASPDGANAQIEGDDVASFQAAAPTTRIGNYAQISRKTLVLSDTNEVVDKAGRGSELAYQLAKRGKELKRDMETIVLSNQAANAGSSSTARKTGTLLAFIKTNVDLGASGANPVYTSLPQATRTDGTLRTITEPMLKNGLQLCWTNGAAVDTVMVGALVKQTISTFTGIATKFKDVKSDSPATIIGAADVYVSDFGTVSIVPNRFQRARDAFLIDFDMAEVDYLRPFKKVELAKTGDAEKRMLIAEWGLRVKNEQGLGLVADVSN